MGVTLHLVLADQLNPKHSWFECPDPNKVFLFQEVRSETDYVVHHIQKVVALFAAMRNFAKTLENQGHRVIYIQLDHPSNLQELTANTLHIAHQISAAGIRYMEPDEYRLNKELLALKELFSGRVEMVSTEHFLTERNAVADFFKDRKTFLMEHFYRDLRKKYGVLMVGQQPVGGQWNYDHSNRKPLPSSHRVPKRPRRSRDVSDLVQLLQASGVKTLGHIANNSLAWPVKREEALHDLEEFIAEYLPYFGDFQDALSNQTPFLYHSLLSFALNTKMLHPLEVIEAAERAFRQGKVPLESTEGFIRQILGWREYIRGYYWARMPKAAEENYFNHTRSLPSWYWTGNTKMACLKQAIDNSLEYAYAHHIQRLMVTGNFALLMGCAPDEVDRWYLGIYIDAFEWVELPNTRGMSQWADGGLLATKPYTSSAAYLYKMGAPCSNCHYNHKEKTGEKACPFNSLYWHFIWRNQEKLSKNQRMSMVFATCNKMDKEHQKTLINQAEMILSNLDEC